MTHEKATLEVIMLVRYSYLHDSPCILYVIKEDLITSTSSKHFNCVSNQDTLVSVPKESRLIMYPVFIQQCLIEMAILRDLVFYNLAGLCWNDVEL